MVDKASDAALAQMKVNGAVISPCGRYRYRLWRIWNDALPLMIWIMLNPSTADAESDDPTIRKCRGFAERHGCGGIIVVNLFAFRATDPDDVPKAIDPIGPFNDGHIEWATWCAHTGKTPTIVAGWGTKPFARARAAHVKALIRGAEGRQVLQCFRRSASGAPWHPLYLPYDSELRPLP